MSVRVGESWQARNGHRRWVSMPLHDFLFLGLLGWGAWAVIVLPLLLLWWALLAEAWIAVESVLLLLTGILAVIALAAKQARPGDVTVTWLRWGLFMIETGRRA
jgi:hypothetical protein